MYVQNPGPQGFRFKDRDSRLVAVF
jgi:hypothetical protein